MLFTLELRPKNRIREVKVKRSVVQSMIESFSMTSPMTKATFPEKKWGGVF